ncbi:MAG TPA: fumarate/nitrate reduction transcriptional regulator Fnr [Methylophilaceae bacterium]|nr:fumarate/nitrate reduction transcriptional regulator Fnr [Methylophilaceae bacterium]
MPATLPAMGAAFLDVNQISRTCSRRQSVHTPTAGYDMHDVIAIHDDSNAVCLSDDQPSCRNMTPETIKVACSNCNLRELCMPIGFNPNDLQRLDEVVATRRRIKQGEHLFSNGDPFTSLYAIRIGFFKTSISSEDGREQVTGFQMAGEIIGLDGIVSDRHSCNAIALEDAEVCVMPFANVEELSREFPVLQRHVHKIMSREIVRENGVMMLLGNMRAEERLAAFLLNLVQRLHARGFSQSEMVLRMTREEIGSYLGLKLETVSRTFSKFQEEGLLEVKQRQIRIVDQAGLQKLVNGAAC